MVCVRVTGSKGVRHYDGKIQTCPGYLTSQEALHLSPIPPPPHEAALTPPPPTGPYKAARPFRQRHFYFTQDPKIQTLFSWKEREERNVCSASLRRRRLCVPFLTCVPDNFKGRKSQMQLVWLLKFFFLHHYFPSLPPVRSAIRCHYGKYEQCRTEKKEANKNHL